MDYLISIVIGILSGVLPSYLLIKKMFPEKNQNNKKILSLFYILIDVVKGLLVVSIIKFILGFDFLNILLALIFATLAHSFFQGFKYRKSEGTTIALSGLTLVIPLLVIIWLVIWIISYAYKRNNNFCLPSATFLTGLLAVTSENIINNEYWHTMPLANSHKEFVILVGLLFIVVVNSQMDRIKSYFFKGKKDN